MERSKKKKGEDGDERKRLRKREDFTHALSFKHNLLARTHTHKHMRCI